MMILSSFSVSFADSYTFLKSTYISSLSSSTVYGNGTLIGSCTGYGDLYTATNLTSDVFTGLVVANGYNDFYFIVPSTVSSSATNFFFAYASNGGQNPATTASTGSGYKAYRNRLTGTYTGNLSTFSSVSDMLSAFSTWTPPSYDVYGDGYLTNGLPVGNVIYFDLGSAGYDYSIDLKSYFTSKSSWFGSSWVNDNRRYGFSNELPTTATNFSESSGSSIPWSPSGSTDLLGRSSEGSATISGTSTARYLWIVNPLYNLGYYDEPDKGSSLNGNIFYIGGISADTPYYLYSLKQSATSLGLSSDVASSVGGVGTVTTSGAINTVVNDGSGNEYTPPVGGDNSPPQEVTAAEGIKQTLDQFVNMFMNIFTAPISHIQQLISMGSEFISHLSGMWSWLPSEVSGFVTSAFVLLIVIGVIKLLI